MQQPLGRKRTQNNIAGRWTLLRAEPVNLGIGETSLTADLRTARVCQDMKPNNKLHVLAGLCLAIAVSPVAVLAQTSPAASPAVTASTSTTTDDRPNREEHHDYGWIGLLGLLGLGGLMRKKDDVHRDTTAGRTDVRR